jgi:hypothetical protein
MAVALLGRTGGVTGGRTDGVPSISMLAGIGVTGGSGRRVGSVGGGC